MAVEEGGGGKKIGDESGKGGQGGLRTSSSFRSLVLDATPAERGSIRH
jgi:hypothetical protein